MGRNRRVGTCPDIVKEGIGSDGARSTAATEETGRCASSCAPRRDSCRSRGGRGWELGEAHDTGTSVRAGLSRFNREIRTRRLRRSAG